MGAEVVFLAVIRLLAVLADQAVDDLPVRDPGGHFDRLAGFMQRRLLFPRLVRSVLVVVPRVLGQDPQSTCRKSHAKIPDAWGAMELPPGW